MNHDFSTLPKFCAYHELQKVNANIVSQFIVSIIILKVRGNCQGIIVSVLNAHSSVQYYNNQIKQEKK